MTDDLFKKGLQKYREGKYSDARELFQQIIQNDDTNPKVWNALGICLTKLGQTEEASNCYDNALMLDPGNETYEKNLRILEKLQNNKKRTDIIENNTHNKPSINENHTIFQIISYLFLFCIFLLVLQNLLAFGFYIIGGTWPSIVTMESESMVPNLNVGDLVILTAHDRFGTVQSLEEGQKNGHEKLGRPGDIIVYRPNGNSNLHPIIHRVIKWVNDGDQIVVTSGQRTLNYTAPHAGYLTKGDNNPVIDQVGWSNYRGLGGPIEPVKNEWIVGKAFFVIPLLGYLSLNTIPFFIVMGMLLILIIWLRKKG